MAIVKEPVERGHYWIKSSVGDWAIWELTYDNFWYICGSDEIFDWAEVQAEKVHGPLLHPEAADSMLRKMGVVKE